jgi:hypothetical protein
MIGTDFVGSIGCGFGGETVVETPSGADAPDIEPEPEETPVLGIPGIVEAMPGMVEAVPGPVGCVPEACVGGIAAGYDGSAGPLGVYPPAGFCCGIACACGLGFGGAIRLAVSTPRTINPVTNSNAAMI